MKKFIIAGVFLMVGVIMVTTFAIAQARRDTKASKIVLHQFFAEVENHRYDRAQQLFSANLRESVSAQNLEEQCRRFETKHGAISKWIPVQGSMGSGFSMVPRFVDFTHHIQGRKGEYGYVVARMVYQDGLWRIEKLNIVG